ncbi:MAG: hypothetical protein HLX46_02570 [Corynebacterium sp.]|uniref:hypothetical protein n=1 Tax=Corynebacterium sp. TaxID=1720 RepID=UPI00179F41A4|nr:hypothetical protein [Corynebacterium sp.]NWO15734.1 hypothetical protein [Corynebacterium sp.]
MSAKKYRKKPVEIEAIQLTKDNVHEVTAWCGGQAAESLVPWTGRGLKTVLNIFTLEGKMMADYGDYIVKGVKGEFYPCKPDIFAETYEEVV